MDEEQNEFIRKVNFEAAFDKRHPDPAKNCGIHGVNIRFVLIGKKGAVQFLLYTNWQLPRVTEEHDRKPVDKQYPHLLCRPMPADLGYHSRKPRYDGQEPMSDNCDILGGPCYYDGSTLNAEPVYNRLLAEGDRGVWAALEEYYIQVFE